MNKKTDVLKNSSLDLIYITNDPAVALIAEKNDVDYIMVDLETLGKEERQKNMDTVKSHHCVQDIEALAKVLTKSTILVRVNPINPNSKEEIDCVINAGAGMIMLPMWKSVKEVRDFLSFVSGRVRTMLLLETKEAVECLDEVFALGGFSDIHIGLNDLHLSYGLDFMFELLANGEVEKLCKKMKKADVKYGFGGIARMGEGMIPAEKIVMEHYRLGSTRTILSRSFCNTVGIIDLKEVENVFENNVARLRSFEKMISGKSADEYADNQKEILQCVSLIVKGIRERRNDDYGRN